MEVHIYVRFWILKVDCTQYGDLWTSMQGHCFFEVGQGRQQFSVGFIKLISFVLGAGVALAPIHLPLEAHRRRSEMTQNYWMMVERYPNLKEEVGNSISNCKISSLIDRKLARWSTASCALALACQPSVSNEIK